MLDGRDVVVALKAAGVSHVIWLPDSYLGQWDAALSGPEGLPLIRVCREGEAIAIAGGLLLGGQWPIVLLQCTGLFEAGDALRNIVHDLKLPLFLLVGARGWKQSQHNRSLGRPAADTCAVFLEDIVRAWRIGYTWLTESSSATDLATLYRQQARLAKQAHCVLVPE